MYVDRHFEEEQMCLAEEPGWEAGTRWEQGFVPRTTSLSETFEA
jgi:hypothetical protein